jgi:hypothetical protein
MPKRTDKELITQQLKEAKLLHAEVALCDATIESEQQRKLEKSWQIGKRLNAIKEDIGHGNWLLWLKENWPEIGTSTAQLYMKIDRENPNAQRVRDLKHDTIRQHAIASVPKKQHPEQEGDATIEKANDCTGTLNELNRQAQRYESGLLVIDDPDEFCDDAEQGMIFGLTIFKQAGRLEQLLAKLGAPRH